MNSPTLQTEPSSDGVQVPGSVPLYVSGFLVTLSSLLSVGLLLDEDPGFVPLTVTLTVIGFVVSFLIRRQNVNAYSIELPAAALCILLAVALSSERGLPFLTPIGLEGDRAKGLAVTLIWITVFRSYTLVSDGSVLFSCVLSIAIMGLVGTMSSDPILTRYYALFVSSAAFMLVHESFLSGRRRQPVSVRPRQSRMFAGQIQAALLCAIGAILLAVPVSTPLQAVGSLLAFTPSTPGTVQRPNQTKNSQRISVAEQQQITVGTGPVNLSDQPLMRVRASQGSYWRGAAFNVYTGRGWSNSLDEPELITPETAGRTPDDIFLDPQQTGKFRFKLEPNAFTTTGKTSYELEQRIRFVGSGLFRDIYAAPEIRSLQMTEHRAQRDAFGAIQLYRVVAEAEYEVTSQVPDSRPETLVAAKGEYPAAIAANFLGALDQANPSSMSRLRAHAESLTAGKVNPYEKVQALKTWIETNCKYNTNTPAIPLNVDVSEHFLFATKEGYCDSFATALAVLCRSIRIPARVASGFAPGSFEAETQEYVVRERDKHLWTEVFFPNIGWVTFDATEGAEDISARDDANKNKGSGSLLAFLFSRGPLPPLALLLMLALFAYVIKVEVWDRFRPRRIPLEHLALPPTNRQIVLTYDQACRVLAKTGRPRLASVTPDEYLVDLHPALVQYPELRAILERLTAMLIRFRYGSGTATEADVIAAREQLAALRAALRPVRRRDFAATIPSAEPV